jgi:glycosyltransferase involved in cell wall biosynthesis
VLHSHNAVKGILLKELSRLPETKMETNADTIISKISKPSDKKKIMFSSAHWLTGGMERVMSTLFGELKNDYEIFLITPYDERKSCIEVPDFVTSIKIANDLFGQHFDSLILSYALLLDIDVAIGLMNMFEKQLNLYNLCVGTKIKTIASNHEYYFYPYKSPYHYDVVEKRLSAFAKCNAKVWPLNFNAALCGMYVDNNYVIGNPNNFEISKEKDSAPRETMILCVGRFNDYVKRIDRILECFSIVLKKVPDAKLVLVGKYDKNNPFRQDDSTTVNDLIKRLAIPPNSLKFVGEVDNVQDYYRRAKVLMLTSNSEGFGMVINEAACFGVPSVCNYIPGIEDLIVNGENGFITEQDDIGSMAIKVCDILLNDGLHERLSENAKKKVEEYDSGYIGDKWRYLISSLIDIKDDDDLHKKLDGRLGYKIKDKQLFLKVLSGELNEIFYMAIKQSGQHQPTKNTVLILSKIKRLPSRLRTNIGYEGWYRTSKKIAARSFLMTRKIFKI